MNKSKMKRRKMKKSKMKRETMNKKAAMRAPSSLSALAHAKPLISHA